MQWQNEKLAQVLHSEEPPIGIVDVDVGSCVDEKHDPRLQASMILAKSSSLNVNRVYFKGFLVPTFTTDFELLDLLTMRSEFRHLHTQVALESLEKDKRLNLLPFRWSCELSFRQKTRRTVPPQEAS